MQKITRHYKFDYENDTTIEYVDTGMYSMLNCSFTSEDPDYGTDTLHFTSDGSMEMAQFAYNIVGELTSYLNKMDSGRYCEVSHDQRRKFGDYGNSTLYAIEKALTDIASEYRARSWFGHLEDVTREIARRMIKEHETFYSFCESDQLDWDRYSPNEYEQVGSEWFGIKRLDPIFDNGKDEYIVAVGYYGGGFVKTAYEMVNKNCIEENINHLARQLCDIIESITDLGPQGIVFAMEEEEK